MNITKHTPGPWEAFTEPEFSGWWAIRQVTDDGINHKVGSSDGGFEFEDAKLMAAAPELLAALRVALKVFLNECDPDEYSDQEAQIRAAIDKATESKP